MGDEVFDFVQIVPHHFENLFIKNDKKRWKYLHIMSETKYLWGLIHFLKIKIYSMMVF